MNDKPKSSRQPRHSGQAAAEDGAHSLQQRDQSIKQDSPLVGSPEKNTSKSTSQSRNRRRPRKLNRVTSTAKDATAHVTQKQETQSDISNEIESLKTRVEDIERQVGDMLATKTGGTKSSRRRLRRNRSAAEGETETQELERLKENLVEANKELTALHQGTHEATHEEVIPSNEDTDIEEIPRFENTSPTEHSRPAITNQHRSVTLSGSYKINLPSAVNNSDIQAVQTGLHGVQNIAKKFMAERSLRDTRTVSEERIMKRTQNGEGWSSWLGGYTLSIARFINQVSLDDGKVGTEPSTSTAETVRRRPRKLRVASSTAIGDREQGIKGD